jgi:hypothetical protein
VDLVTEADVAEDRPTPLGHTVELTLFHIPSVGQGCQGEDLTG